MKLIVGLGNPDGKYKNNSLHFKKMQGYVFLKQDNK